MNFLLCLIVSCTRYQYFYRLDDAQLCIESTIGGIEKPIRSSNSVLSIMPLNTDKQLFPHSRARTTGTRRLIFEVQSSNCFTNLV